MYPSIIRHGLSRWDLRNLVDALSESMCGTEVARYLLKTSLKSWLYLGIPTSSRSEPCSEGAGDHGPVRLDEEISSLNIHFATSGQIVLASVCGKLYFISQTYSSS